MTVATWNVNSIRSRLPRLLAWLDRQRPDVVCLQETKTPDDRFPHDDLRRVGYHALIWGQPTYNGVAILSRQQGADVLRGLPGDGADAPRRLVAATVAGLRVVNVYAPNGTAVGSDRYAYKLEWLRRLRAFLASVGDAGDGLILCGDLNIAPEDRDVWDPPAWRGQIMTSEPEREAFRALRDGGLADALRLHHPDQDGLYTWWDYRAGAFHRNWGLRIDHILLSAGVASRCTAIRIDRDERKGPKPSDHAPVIATLA